MSIWLGRMLDFASNSVKQKSFNYTMKKLFQKILVALSRAHIQKYKPMIIGVTGNARKTSTKEAIGTVLRRLKTVRIAAGNLNNELGFALTILGNWDREYYEAGSSAGLWLRVLGAGIRGLIARNCPEIFLLRRGFFLRVV